MVLKKEPPMARVKDGEQEALLREAEAVPGCHGDKSHCAECVFLALPAITETGIPPEAVCLLTGLGGSVGGHESAPVLAGGGPAVR